MNNLFYIDHRMYDAHVYVTEAKCVVCNIPYDSKDFFKDQKVLENGMKIDVPFYFHNIVDEVNNMAVMFCSPKCCSDWSLTNKDKIKSKSRK